MLAIPMGIVGVLVILPLTHTTLNVMSLMGVLMLVGIADSNSILIVDFAHNLEEQGMSVTGCRHHRVPRAAASDPDDLAGHDHRHDSHGYEVRGGGRAIYPDGARDHRRFDFIRTVDCVHRPGRVRTGLPE